MNLRSRGLGWVLVVLLAGGLGCAKPLGRYPCEANECFGQNLWQKALDQIAEKNFPGKYYAGQVFADKLDNAWTTQGNRVNITSSLMLKLDQRGDLYVLGAAAHEIAHLQANHYLVQSGVTEAAPEKTLKMEERPRLLLEDEALAALSRKQELEADTLAVQYLINLGYTREDYLNFLKWMEHHLEDARPSPLASHPTTGERIEHIRLLNPAE